jgi:hypothetical protein
MTHVDPDVLALAALGELGELVASGADQEHLAGCPACRAEWDRLAEVVRVARSGGMPEPLMRPPEAVWSRITAALEADDVTERRFSAQRGRAPAAPASRGRWPRLLPVMAACLLAGAGAAVGVQQLTSSQVSSVGATTTLRPLPQFPQWRHASGTAAMERGPGGWLLRVSLNATPGQGFFEVWLLGRDGVRMISLGDLSRQRTGTFAVPPGADLSFYSRIDVSLQPFNGSTGHSKVSVVRGPLP